MSDQVDRWWSLPERTRTDVLTLLAALVARGVLIEATTGSVDAGSVDAGSVDAGSVDAGSAEVREDE
jgi:hypothetical protein